MMKFYFRKFVVLSAVVMVIFTMKLGMNQVSLLSEPMVLLTSTSKPFYGHTSLKGNESFFVPGNNIFFSLNHAFLLNGSNICKDKDVYMVIFILSLHDKTTQRTAIRQTWGSVAKTSRWPGTMVSQIIKIVFLFGVHQNPILNEIVRVESDVHGDIVQANFKETYSNLTLKVLMGFKWLSIYCPRTKFVMKTDEDSFIVLPKLLHKLESQTMDNTILGPFFLSDTVFRSGKYKVDRKVYPLSMYPPHCKGNLYLMPARLATKIVAVSNHFPYMRMEDVFITGILAKVFDARHVNLEESEYDKYKSATMCELSTGSKILSQRSDAKTQYKIWNTLLEPIMCS
ncbi:beta-1,3-galactosyltransferase 5-like [Patella vulgata]|uniref:beta-1,3-galactosyltransferase 5-like n=1 Tax=Patella vulgata TaxID=6465 RepID=UPI0024A8D52E|nr:beta-1,3-galactosyltransferase 5-like [Patella vulgata]